MAGWGGGGILRLRLTSKQGSLQATMATGTVVLPQCQSSCWRCNCYTAPFVTASALVYHLCSAPYTIKTNNRSGKMQSILAQSIKGGFEEGSPASSQILYKAKYKRKEWSSDEIQKRTHPQSSPGDRQSHCSNSKRKITPYTVLVNVKVSRTSC